MHTVPTSNVAVTENIRAGHSTKVVIYLSTLGRGGAQRVAANLANDLHDHGYDVCIVCLHTERPDDYELNPHIKRVSLNKLTPRQHWYSGLTANYQRWLAVRRALVEESPDVVISLLTSSNVLSILACIGTSIPVIVSERTYPPRSNVSLPWKFLRVAFYRLANNVVVQSEKSKHWLIDNFVAKRISIIPNTVYWPPSTFPSKVEPPSARGSELKKLLAVGRLVPQKGFNYLLEAYASLAVKYPDWDLYIIGVGDQSRLQKDINDRGLQDRVQLVGQVGNLVDWYEAADLFVLSSVFEGFPNCLAEAMAAGLPVASFDCPTGPSDLIQHEVNGLLVEPEIDDESLRQRLGIAAKDVVIRYSAKNTVSLWEALISQACDKLSPATDFDKAR